MAPGLVPRLTAGDKGRTLPPASDANRDATPASSIVAERVTPIDERADPYISAMALWM